MRRLQGIRCHVCLLRVHRVVGEKVFEKGDIDTIRCVREIAEGARAAVGWERGHPVRREMDGGQLPEDDVWDEC